MECSNCKERMSNKEITGFSINSCIYCNGIWIGGAELKNLLSIESGAPSISKIRKYCDTQSAISDKRKCPSCINTALHIVTVRGVELDYCTNCDGVFFDDNEIKQILTETIKSDIKNNHLGKYVVSEGLFWTLILFFSGRC